MQQLVLGVGNTLQGDDGVGHYVVERLNSMLNDVSQHPDPAGTTGQQLLAVDCGTIPESFTSLVRRHRPDSLVIVDAAHMGLAAGAVRTIPPHRINVLYASTHTLPLSLLIAYLGDLCGEVTLVGVQPHTIEFGSDTLSGPVRDAAEALVKLILERQLARVELLESTRGFGDRK
jgi:hydrogenase 3 maturation protease